MYKETNFEIKDVIIKNRNFDILILINRREYRQESNEYETKCKTSET